MYMHTHTHKYIRKYTYTQGVLMSHYLLMTDSFGERQFFLSENKASIIFEV